jgi:hypothetical protein
MYGTVHEQWTRKLTVGMDLGMGVDILGRQILGIKLRIPLILARFY